MPQVFFNTDTFRPDSFPTMSEKLLCDLSEFACREHPEIGRKIGRQWLLYKVPNFLEAFRDGFDGWHLHHVTGESVDRRTLVNSGLYEGRPWWELRFMKELEHRRIHAVGDVGNVFRNHFYAMEPPMEFYEFVKSNLQ
jgi:hypothetical protein